MERDQESAAPLGGATVVRVVPNSCHCSFVCSTLSDMSFARTKPCTQFSEGAEGRGEGPAVLTTRSSPPLLAGAASVSNARCRRTGYRSLFSPTTGGSTRPNTLFTEVALKRRLHRGRQGCCIDQTRSRARCTSLSGRSAGEASTATNGHELDQRQCELDAFIQVLRLQQDLFFFGTAASGLTSSSHGRWDELLRTGSHAHLGGSCRCSLFVPWFYVRGGGKCEAKREYFVVT